MTKDYDKMAEDYLRLMNNNPNCGLVILGKLIKEVEQVVIIQATEMACSLVTQISQINQQ